MRILRLRHKWLCTKKGKSKQLLYRESCKITKITALFFIYKPNLNKQEQWRIKKFGATEWGGKPVEAEDFSTLMLLTFADLLRKFFYLVFQDTYQISHFILWRRKQILNIINVTRD